MNYQKDKEYDLKYANDKGEVKEIKIVPEKDMTSPEMIVKLKNDNKDFFKLLEESKCIKESDDFKTYKVSFYVDDTETPRDEIETKVNEVLKNSGLASVIDKIEIEEYDRLSESKGDKDSFIKYEDEKLKIDISEYENNGNIALVLYNSDGDLFDDLTVNIIELPANQACINVNDLDGANIMNEYKLGTPTGDYINSGFLSYPVYKLNMDTIKRYAFSESLEEDKKLLTEDTEDNVTSNTGFYIGDPCYVLPDETYDEVWGEQYGYERGKIIVGDNAFLVHGTAYGDGEYYDDSGYSYGVDSGTLAVIPFELIKRPEIMPSEGEYEYGRFVAGTLATLDYVDGVFTFTINDTKSIIIDTDQAYDDYDYEDEEDEYNYEDEDDELEDED